MKKAQLAINSISTAVNIKADDFEKHLEAYQSAGFKNIEFCLKHIKDYMSAGHSVADVRKLFNKHNITCIGGFGEAVVDCFTSNKKDNNSKVKENVTLMAELGGKVLVVGTNGPEGSAVPKDTVGEIANTMARIAGEIKNTGVSLCIEFNWSPVVRSLRTAADVVRRAGVRNVGVLFDTAHYHCTPTKFTELNADNIKYVKHVHINDMSPKGGDVSNCNADRVLPGKGCLDLKAIIKAIEKHGYKGYFAIEMFNEKLWSLPPKKSAKLMYNSLLPFLTTG
ncbi:MAG: sugar phosphate isomerase/epimerase [Candidatus Omnitrophica bacterium]|nr:sugar phosphate isomerase/epimerase [Candidatus Omnitrophota bacterium]